MVSLSMDPERQRLAEAHDRHAPWRRWGPYLAERQWGTVREDYSPDGQAWGYFPHDQARSRAYRWGEDGLLGICDTGGRLCLALALWNERDPILKERLFGLTGPEGNHGEDVKECYYYLDATPTASYLRGLYKYPQAPFPYAELVAVNGRRGRPEPEYELLDTGVFDQDRYFDVAVEYAKAAPDDLVMRLTVFNRGPETAPLQVLPTLWYRNTWTWHSHAARPELGAVGQPGAGWRVVQARHHALGQRFLHCQGRPELLFTENESNAERLWGAPNPTRYVKDGIDLAVVQGRLGAVNPDGVGTKVAARYRLELPAGGVETILLRFADRRLDDPFGEAAAILAERQSEADLFYRPLGSPDMPDDARAVQRQALAGMLWSKQFYSFDVTTWLDGDPGFPRPAPGRGRVRNGHWRHLDTHEVLSMPDKWEYPWFAAWDLAFHCIPLALVDPEFAKQQLIVLLREWYMHPNGQLPAYEWAFDDVNPPVHAWAAWRVYKIEQRLTGQADQTFLERVFHKLLLNFTWWVNRKDSEGRNVFQGGFLGLDNIGVFDRSKPLPTGGSIEQADGTAWMGMYCLSMLAIGLELAAVDHAYEDVATKFFEHFLYIAGALNNLGGQGIALWDDEDEFFYDVLQMPNEQTQPLRVRSVVGLIPLLAVETVESDLLERLPGFRARMEWFLTHRPELAQLVSRWSEPGQRERRLLALVHGHRMKRLLDRLLDEREFLSDHGVRALSRRHLEAPYRLRVDGRDYEVRYDPAEATTGLFGGNSNWRGPVWFPLNFLLIEALQRFHHYYGDDFKVECPTGSGRKLTLWEVADELSRRLTSLFLRGRDGRRPIFGASEKLQRDPHWRDHLLFHEYFHGDTGAGLGASHQTGWTGLVAKLIEQTDGR
jgi:hypothetical protein